MPPPISQEHRLGKLHPAAPLQQDDLVLLRFNGTEAVNELFGFTVEAMSALSSINLDEVIGRHFTVEITTIYGTPRYFDGILTHVRNLGVVEGGMGYELTLRPMIWVLDRRHNQRIFHNQNVQQIITQVLGDYGFQANFDVGQMQPLEYTVEYGETDLAFIRRMMERFGLNFYFEHALGNHTLKINDGDFSTRIEGVERRILTSERQHVSREEHFDNWSHDRLITSGRVRLTDYNFKTPATSLEESQAHQSGGVSHPFGDLEVFAYPGGYQEPGQGRTTAATRLRQIRAADNHHHATGDVMSLAAGMVVKATGSADGDVNDKDFVALSCSHAFTAARYASGSGSGSGSGEDAYRGAYEFSPKAQAIAPAMVTPRACIQGPQIAIVVGSGEIDCDEFGRILVLFPWDGPAARSMRCRVMQPWAGSGWGNIFIPRVGMEVVVQFFDGDPDHPVVTGCLYNSQNMPPYGLPGEQNIAGVRSQTVGGGGYNEFVMDDTSGNELVRTHAQCDMETTVEHDERHTVKNDQHVTVENDRHLTVQANQTTEVTEEYHVTADQKMLVEVGACTFMMDGTQIQLSIGPSKLTMTMTGVTITGMDVTTNGTTSASHLSSGSLVVKGGVVFIN